MFSEFLNKTPGRINIRGRKPMKCNFTGPNPAGACRECGSPAEPGAKQICIDCAIEAGAQPVKTPEKSEETDSK